MAQAARDYIAKPLEVDIECLLAYYRTGYLGIRRFSMGMDTLRTLVFVIEG
jgi:hypothetical protein